MKKYNLAGIKRAGNRCAHSSNGDFTCILLWEECDKRKGYPKALHETLNLDIFDIRKSGFASFAPIMRERLLRIETENKLEYFLKLSVSLNKPNMIQSIIDVIGCNVQIKL